MRILFIFLDGVGLGRDDPDVNPFARARMPNLEGLLGGRRLIAASAPFEGRHATLLGLDTTLGIPGMPQSATGQAVLLTGANIPAEIGQHYGPKPSPAVARRLASQNLFSDLVGMGRTAALLNAYPPRYFHGVASGKRLYSSIPLAVTSAGLRLFDKQDFFDGRALSADFTGAGWASMLGFPDAPVHTPIEAGRLLARLANAYDFSLFEYWATDYAGHKQDMKAAIQQLEVFDAVLQGLLSEPNHDRLVLITSDHGNLEDISTRRHTLARVPAILIGPSESRRRFGMHLDNLTGIAPAIRQVLKSAS